MDSMFRRRRENTTLSMPGWLWSIGWWVSRIVLSLFFSLVILFIWRIVKAWDRLDWFGEEPYRILFVDGDRNNEPTGLRLVTIWPDTQRVAAVSIPAAVTIPAVGGYGNYRVAALPQLGQIEGVGDALLTDSVGFTFGVPVYLTIWQSGKDIDWTKAQRILLFDGFVGNKSLPETLDLWRLLNVARNGIVDETALSEKNVVRTRQDQADGSSVAYLEPALLDAFIGGKLAGIWEAAAQTQVAVVNASGKPQMAAAWSRLPRFMGLDVVSVTDQPEVMNDSYILFDNEQILKSPVGQSLIRLFPIVKVRVTDTSRYRAEVAVLIGTDNWSWLSQRQAFLNQAHHPQQKVMVEKESGVGMGTTY